MTNEERDIITQFIARVSGATQPSGYSGGSVPATRTALPPVDREADAFIAQTFTQYPEARYRITQLAFVQEHALVEAQNRIKRLEWELQQAQQAAGPAPSGSGGFFSGLFGGGGRQQQGGPPPGYGSWNQRGPQQQQQGYYPQSGPPQPQYPPNYQQGMFQRQGQGSGFLGSALTTAAGVAGGLVAGNALMGLFSSHGSGAADAGLGAAGAAAGAASPWAAPAESAGEPYVDSGTWDQPTSTDQDTSWSDGGGGGWDDGGGSDDTF